MKKLIAALLCLILIAFFLPFALRSASAEVTSGQCGENLYWSFDSETGVLAISGIGEMTDYGIDETSVPWYSVHAQITELVLPDGLTTISSIAFYDCTSLAAVEIPDSVTSIGDAAFCGCIGLSEIAIPDSVTSIGDSAFSGCTGLTSVTIGRGIKELKGFSNCTSLTSISIPDSVTSIGVDAFYGCSGLTSITIPDSVTSIGESAFQGCTGLSEITIPDGVTSIGDGAFAGCTGLTEITIPDGVTSIGDSAFYGCSGLTEITIPDSVTSIGDAAFCECTGLMSVTLPDSVTSIGQFAFYGCTGLTSITIPDGVTSIAGYTFCECTGLTEIAIPDSVKSVGWHAFFHCTGLTEITIPDSVTKIEYGAFQNCEGLISATIGNGLTSIDESVFSRCIGLTTVTLKDGLKAIGDNMFSSCTGLTEITIPDSVTSIGNSAFYKCTGLTEISIGNGLTSIGYQVFANCTGLTEIMIPDSVRSIGENAFYNCTHLTSITMPCSASIGNASFVACMAITSVHLTKGTGTMPSYSLSSDRLYYTPWYNSRNNALRIALDDGIRNIGSYTFYQCTGLTSITIPDSVTSIGRGAFFSCTGLTDVFYSGTRQMRSSISLEGDNEYLMNAEWHYLKPVSIEMKTLPSKLIYLEGESLDVAGGVITAYYDDEIIEDEPLTEEMVSGFNNSTAGEQTLTVAFEDKSTSYTVTVSHAPGDPVHENEIRATCTEGGSYDAVVYCTGCHTELSREHIEVSVLGHALEHHDAKAPTCTEIGWEAYDTCSRCDYTTYAEVAALGHDLQHHDTKAPTCTETGWKAYDTCSRCDYTTYAELAARGHDLIHHDAKAPTCTEIGWEAYDTCSRCDYTTYAELAALGHDLIHHDAKAPTCTEIGWEAYDTCSRCDYTTYAELAALGHDLIHHDAKAPTCTEIGWEAYDTCSRCDYTTYAELAALGHDLIHHDAKAPTCTEIGWEAYDTCSRCDYTTYAEIPANGHTPGKPVRENEVAATTAAEGHYDEVVYCTVCHAELSRERHSIPKLPVTAFDGTVTIDPNDVKLNGKTPYRVYDGKAQTPRVVVKDRSGKTIAASKYTVSYRNNTNPGTAYADIKMKDTGTTASVWFKIYLPPTVSTSVQNVNNGIQVSWKKVDGAKGYVIYRRAWNLKDAGWMKFERWNNTTKTTWVDTKVYAGTRYQYGVKAYFADPMDNYNLGIVGPLKTTVRITTRTLNSVTPGSKKLTVKWSGSTVFTGYEVQVATDAKFTKDVKTVTVGKANTYQTAVSGLKAKTLYYVRVRSYHIFDGMTYYGGWSNVLNGKTK